MPAMYSDRENSYMLCCESATQIKMYCIVITVCQHKASDPFTASRFQLHVSACFLFCFFSSANMAFQYEKPDFSHLSCPAARSGRTLASVCLVRVASLRPGSAPIDFGGPGEAWSVQDRPPGADIGSRGEAVLLGEARIRSHVYSVCGVWPRWSSLRGVLRVLQMSCVQTRMLTLCCWTTVYSLPLDLEHVLLQNMSFLEGACKLHCLIVVFGIGVVVVFFFCSERDR